MPYQLSEKIDKETRSEWIGAMLRTTGIEPDYYRFKYCEPISDQPSKKNKEFAEVLKEILGGYFNLSSLIYTALN